MGKSRLVYEFRRSLAGERVTYLEGRCLSFGASIPYLPVLDIVRRTAASRRPTPPRRWPRRPASASRRSGWTAGRGPPTSCTFWACGRHGCAGGPEPRGDQGEDLRDRPPARPERQQEAADHPQRRGPSLDRLHLPRAVRLAGGEPVRCRDPAAVHLTAPATGRRGSTSPTRPSCPCARSPTPTPRAWCVRCLEPRQQTPSCG